MTSFKLSPQAEQSLEDIIGWTIDQFGIEQAIKYKDQLLNRLAALSAGEPPYGKPFAILLPGPADVPELEYYREGKHYIVYQNTNKEMIVLDFVHGSRNLEAIANELKA